VKKKNPSIPTESPPVELVKKKQSVTPLYPTADMDLSKCLDTRDPPHLITKVTGEIHKVNNFLFLEKNYHGADFVPKNRCRRGKDELM